MATLAVLVVACPCAMGIAAPLATAVAIAFAARRGVAVRGGEAMERLGQVTDVFLDKTGTLTLGEPTVRDVLPAGDIDPNRLLTALAGLESASEHVLAKAVLSEAARRGLPLPPIRDVQAVPGGITGQVCLDGQWHRVVAGSENRDSHLFPCMTSLTKIGDCPYFRVDVDGAVWGHVAVEDQPRSDAASAVEQLRALGVRVTLLSGDRAEAAEPLAARMGISAVESRCEPGRKMELLRLAREANHAVTAMVGDGINDAPALAQADIGIAMGGGTDLAKRAGNVVLLSNRLEQIPWLIALSRRTRKVIWQNLAWAIAYNAVALAAAAAGVLHPLLAAVAMIVSSLTLLGNSLRLGR
jgi:heavy metal translocating P-type ATPase